MLNNYCKINKISKSLFTVAFSYATYEMGITLPGTISRR